MTSYPPHSILWTPLGPISYLLPVVGHVGISNWRGDKLVDFSGRSADIVNRMMGGPPHLWFVYPSKKGKEVSEEEEEEKANKWDEALEYFTKQYKDDGMVHRLLKENCHHFVAKIINRYNGNSKLNAISIHWMFFLNARPFGRKVGYLLQFLLTWFTLACLIVIVAGLLTYNKK